MWRKRGGGSGGNLVRPTRFERVTPAFGGQYSIHLSYGRIGTLLYRFKGCGAGCRIVSAMRFMPRDCRQLRSQMLFAAAVRRPPGGKRQIQKRLFNRCDGMRYTPLIEPSAWLGAQLLDLSRQLVADRPRRLDLAPHARRDLQVGGKGLLESLGRGTGSHRPLGVSLKQVENILSPQNCGIRQFVYVRCNRSEDYCRRGLTNV